VEVDVPDGFEFYDRSFLWSSDRRGHRALSFWSITGIDPDPCRGSPAEYQELGDGVEAVASAIAEQSHRTGGPASPVMFAGYDGLYLDDELRHGPALEATAAQRHEAHELVGGTPVLAWQR
jgi:hypothetical protein